MTTHADLSNDTQYIPVLDGIRALAVLAVFGFHLEELLPASSVARTLLLRGWVGVDVFFTLSGFLITRILLQEQDSAGRISVSRFYIRRALRLIPAYVVVMAATTGLLLLAGSETQSEAAIEALPWLLTYTSNFAAALGVSLPLTLHTWSLAIEEQYYLAYPWIVRTGDRARLLWGLTLVVIAIGVVRAIGFYWWPIQWPTPGTLTTSVYFLTPFRIDSILYGGIVAYALSEPEVARRLRSMVRQPAAVPVATGLLALTVVFFADHNAPATYIWVLPLISCLTAFMLAALVSGRQGMVAGILSWAGLLWIGRLSYGFYLLHPLAISATKDLVTPAIDNTWLEAAVTGGLSLVATLLAAQVLRMAVERPFLRWKDAFRQQLGSS